MPEAVEGAAIASATVLAADRHAQLRTMAMTDASDDALAKVTSALDEFPDSADLKKLAGITHYRRKEYDRAESLLDAAMAAAPADTEACIFLMRVHYNAGSDDKCETVARTLLSLAPLNVDALRTLGRLLNRRRDWAAAAEMWQRLAAVRPADAEAPLQAARGYFRIGRMADALACADEALALSPDNTDALQIKFDAAVSSGRHDLLVPIVARSFALTPAPLLTLIHRLAQGDDVQTAGAMLAELRRAHPADDRISQATTDAADDWRTLAVRHELKRNDKMAASYLCALRTLAPEDRKVNESIARVKNYFLSAMRDAALIGQHDAAEEAARFAILLDPAAHEAWFAIGEEKLAVNDATGAVESLRRAVEGDPKSARYWLNYARALRQLDENIQAVAAYRKVIELSPGQTPYTIEAQQALNQFPAMLVANARRAVEDGRPLVALGIYDFLAANAAENPATVALLPSLLRTLLNAVRQAYKTQSPSARLLAERYLAYAPDSTEVELTLARILMREKAYELALPYWLKLSAAKPDDAHYHLQMARCHFRIGDPEAAGRAAARALELDPSVAEAQSILTQSGVGATAGTN